MVFEPSLTSPAGRPSTLVWSLFPADTGYFGGSAGFMINYRVMDPEGSRVELWEPPTGLHA